MATDDELADTLIELHRAVAVGAVCGHSAERRERLGRGMTIPVLRTDGGDHRSAVDALAAWSGHECCPDSAKRSVHCARIRMVVPIGKLTLVAEEYAQMQQGLALLNGNAAALRTALGYPVTLPAVTPTAEPTAVEGASLNGRRPGERTLGRDPVGSAA